ncbi:MAG: molybdate ABC transporter substrate-binding protein [Rhodobacter sp.]|nr:molybdate ABC transporter substrate-binding protein [Rhodobacter sp.]
MTRAFLILLFWLFAQTNPAFADRITVAVASNFLTTARDISAVFEAETGHEVALVHGSSGKLFAQITAGAPYDVFLSADRARPERLAETGRAVAGSVKPYAYGRLALVHGAKTAPATLDQILSRTDLRIAIADPAIAPYGVAAREVLREFRGPTWAQDLVYGESVGQAFAFVATGNADAGLVALAQAKTYQGDLWVLEVPEDLHDPIEQDAALLTRAGNNAAARGFLDFLGADFSRDLLIAQGYGVPE